MGIGGNHVTENPSARRATVILFGLCVIAASAIAGAAVYRYVFWGGQVPGGFVINPVDLNGDGSSEYLIAKVVVDLPESGDYTAVATLQNPTTGTALTQTTGRVEMDRGQEIFGIGFWTPDLRKAEASGPYSMQLILIREQSDSPFERPASPDMVGRLYQWTFTTPAYDWRSFQEQPTALAATGPATAVRDDWDGNGIVDQYEISVPLDVKQSGFYSVRAQADQLTLPGVTDRFFPTPSAADLAQPRFVFLAQGPQSVQIMIPPEEMYLSGVDGDFQAHVTISSATESVTSHPCCGTTTESFSESPAFAAPPDGSAFGLRAPYLIPPTPIGVSVETHFTDVVRWYDFRSPWMPIEFVGDVRDFGVDADHDGLFESLAVEAQVNVRTLGSFDLSGTLYAGGSEPTDQILMRSTPEASSIVTTSWTRIRFTDWSQTQSPQTVRLEFTGAEILATGLNGPFAAKLRIVPANVIIDPVLAHTTMSYDLSQFAASGAKPARLPAVGVTSPSTGEYRVQLSPGTLGDGYQVIVRIIHANGVVAVDQQFRATSVGVVGFRTDPGRAHAFAVAVYLVAPDGTGVDYIEVPLSA